MDAHTEDEIREARQLLEECGYVSIFVGKDAEWGMDAGEIVSPAFGLQLSGDRPRDIEQQMLRIKRRYGHDC